MPSSPLPGTIHGTPHEARFDSPCRRRLMRRACARLLQPAGWMLAVALLSSCGGGDSTTRPNASALRASSPGEVLAFVQDRVRARWEARRRGELGGGLNDAWYALGQPVAVAAPGADAAATARSSTVVQEAGVEEDDLIKSDGRAIFTLGAGEAADAAGAGRLRVHRLQDDGRLSEQPSVTLPADESQTYLSNQGLYLSESTGQVAVIGESASFFVGLPIACVPEAPCLDAFLPYQPPRSSVHVVDAREVAQGGSATLRQRLLIDGRLAGSRQIGRRLVLVTVHSPQLPADALPTDASDAERQAALQALTMADILPKVRVDGGAPQALMQDTDCFVQAANASLDLQITAITTMELAAAGPRWSSRCFVGGTEALYMSPQSLYLATTRFESRAEGALVRYAPDTFTDLHKFALQDAGLEYRGSGAVAGHLGWDREKAPLRLSEHQGLLRVLTFTGEQGWTQLADAGRTDLPASPATLTVLQENMSDKTLQTVATLPNAQRPQALGLPGEQIYGVRFLGERAYLVTFRQTDPLYVLDLSAPQDPRIAGELKLPGFSDYLFPLDGGLLLGVGKDASDSGQVAGVKVALFDVRDAASPAVLASEVFGARGSMSGLDFSRHGINLLSLGERVRIALPLGLAATDWGDYSQRLQRLEVDTARRTLTVGKPMGERPVSWPDLAGDRSLQLGDRVVYLTQGELSVSTW